MWGLIPPCMGWSYFCCLVQTPQVIQHALPDPSSSDNQQDALGSLGGL